MSFTAEGGFNACYGDIVIAKKIFDFEGGVNASYGEYELNSLAVEVGITEVSKTIIEQIFNFLNTIIFIIFPFILLLLFIILMKKLVKREKERKIKK
ncbi:MAG: hypothetical protein QXI09_03460 [Candidatus Aenigmatarchaeota archaeon]